MAASTFSYAQAARGQPGPPTQTPPNGISQAEQSTAIPTAANAASLPQTSVDTADQDPASTAPSTTADSMSSLESDTRSEHVQDKRADSRRDDDAGRLDRPWRRNDRGTRSSSATTRSVDEQDSRKHRKGKKNKSSDKQSGESAPAAGQEQEQDQPEPPKVELLEAPIPSVNIWHQRKEAQLAKGVVLSNDSTAENADPSLTNGKMERIATPSVAVDTSLQMVNGAKPQQKSTENARPERNGSRGQRLAVKEARDGKAEVPPPVGDAASWPTPETAIREDKKKPTTEKVDRSDKEAQEETQSKGKKKGWSKLDYTPSAQFETTVPSLMRNSKSRGGAKGANGSRTTAPPAGDKATNISAANKTTESRERPKEPANGSHRNASIPPVAKRPVDGASAREPKKTGPSAGTDKTKDANTMSHTDPTPPAREGRGGRGGFRGRGGHHGLGSHPQHTHPAASAAASSFANVSAPRTPGPYSPPPRQGHGQYGLPQQRGGRGARGSNYHRMSLPNGASRPSLVQTQFPTYEYPPPPMSALPYHAVSFPDARMMVAMIATQIRYYFSVENLIKDVYLRRQMDSQGFVPLSVILEFQRIREMLHDPTLLHIACEEVTEVEYVIGDDDIERLRPRENWEKWILPWDDRDDRGKSPGPVNFHYKNNYVNKPYNYISPGGMVAIPHGAPTPPGYPGFGPFGEEPSLAHGTNGIANGNGYSYGAPTQLSAAVPDFSPSQLNVTSDEFVPGKGIQRDSPPAPIVNGNGKQVNGVHEEDGDQS